MFVEICKHVSQHALRLPEILPAVKALGISGSAARGGIDVFSDVDICIFVEGDYPSGKIRRQAYAVLGFEETIYFDVDFSTSCGDGFIIDGVRCDFNWMVIEKVRESLSGLESDFDCAEWLPGGLVTVKAIHDPQNVITQLQSEIPVYSVARSRHRVQQALQEIHFSLYGLSWLPKAAHRDDVFSFLKHQSALLEKLFYTLFALNRVWYAHEKRLSEQIMDFEAVPANADERIRAAILHTNDGYSLKCCLQKIKSLCADTAQIAQQRYPNLDLPLDWA